MSDIDELDFLEDNITCTYRHLECKRVEDQIVFIHNSGCKFSNNFLKKYINFLNKQSNYYESYCCLHKGHFSRALYELFEYLDPTVEQLKIVCKYKNSYSALKVLLDRNFKISENILSEVLNQKRYRNDNINNIILLSTHKNYKCTINHLNLACEKGLFDIIKFIINKSDDININIKCLQLACKNNNFEIINFFIKFGLHPDMVCLENICSTLNYKLIKLILNYRLIPNEKCLYSIFKSHTDSYHYLNSTNNYQKIINLLINYGFIPKYDNIVFLLSKKCMIVDIYRFNINLDTNILELCYKYNYHPYNIKLKPTIKCLREECLKTNNIKNVKDIVIKKDVRPDIECLRNACKNKTNISIVQFLVESGVTPDLICLKNLSYYFNQNTTLSYIVDQLIKKNSKKDSCTQYNADDPLDNEKTILLSKYKNINLSENKDMEDLDNMKSIDKKNTIKLHKFKGSIEYDVKKKLKINKLLKEALDINKNELTILELRNKFINYFINNKLIHKKNNNYIKLDSKIKKILRIKGRKLFFDFKDIDLFFQSIILNI